MNCRENIYLILWTLLCSQTLCIQYTPVDLGDATDCALILTNAEQYTNNLLQSDFGGPVNCITYEAINQAYSDAKKRIDVPKVDEDWKPEEVAAIGQLILDVSQQISKDYNLNQEDIQVGLPRIDAMKTPIKDICPVYLSAISCRAGRYRRHDGLCNNVDHPTWGATMTPFSRLLPPQFSDHISTPRVSSSGKPLPTARMVSRTIHVDEGYHDHAGTVMLVAWGQFMDHDFTLMGTPLDSQNRNEPEECCYRPEHLKNPYCMEITIPEDDYFYRKFNVRCQDFVRAFPGVQPNCKLGARNPFNTLTAVIDGNTVYGVTEAFSRQLRAGYGGLLKMNPAFAEFGLKELLPMKTDIPDEGCVRTNHSQFCFLAGEIRVNEQLVLTCVHTLMAREHNRIAKELSAINPHWDDEILYQEARRITIAEIQHITFNEFLPLILGREIMEKYGLVLNTEGYWDGYDSNANPGVMDAFSAAAFRFGHSLLPSAIERWSKVHKFIASKRLSELIRRPYDLYRAGVIDEYFMGLLNQVAQAMDDSVTQEVTNHLLKKPGNRFGLDLVSFNIQRGRDFGLPGYMYFRKHCGLPVADSFDEMFGSMPNSTIFRYMTIYESPWDIDLWSGGVSEKPLPGSMVGPTFACIIATQMSMLKQGDRFWYELPNQPSSFTPEQLREIRKVKLSRILCDNTDLIDTIQIYAMVLPDHAINPRVPCRSSVISKPDLSHWIDIPTKSFIDETNKDTTYIKKRNTPNNSTVTPSGYEYHIKTIAIIEGSNPLVGVNDIFDSANIHANHRISKRNANSIVPANATDRSDTLMPSLNFHDNLTITNSSEGKDLTKRHSYYPRQHYQRRPEAEMTQAIMEDPVEPDGEYRRSYHYPADDEYDIEHFFRKNVPIYDGVPAARRVRFRNLESKYHYTPEDDEDEKPMKVVDVHPNEDSDHEYVPMVLDEFGKQRVVESEAEDEEEPPRYSYPYQSSYSDDDSGFQPYRPSYPYRYESSYSSQPEESDSYSKSPPKFGTSHQYNSLADDQPRYYKHFSPFRSQSSYEDKPSYSFPSKHYDYPTSAPYRNHDFVPKRGSPVRGSYTSSSDSHTRKYPPRTTHVPQTLEEYHRIHGHFKEYQPPRPYSPRKPIIVPQDDKEDEDEKEEADLTRGPKSFVSLNFGVGSTPDDDDGVSVRHEIGHFKPKYSYFGHNAYDDSADFPAESVTDSKKFEDADSIKSFVDSVFKQKKVPDTIIGKPIQPVSPYNPHFGDRVKQKTPSQDILWHRSSKDRVARDKLSTHKDDRSVQEDNVREYDNLVKEVTQPAKRDAEDESEEVNAESDPARQSESDEPHFTYWSHSSSEPN